MPKAFFTQTVCLLTDGTTSLQDLVATINREEFDIVNEAPAQSDWRFGGRTFFVEYDSDDNGYAAIDLVNEMWPDTMGDPKTDSATFGAWSTGQFGPFTFPGGLQRAGQHSWYWERGRTIAPSHKGFVRVRISYGFGAKDNAPMLPNDYNALAEMLFLNELIAPMFSAPGILCYFNPNGEVLRDGATFVSSCAKWKEQKLMPLHLWSNIRFFHVDETFALMDTVGNGQLDILDVEAVFPKSQYNPGDVDSYLRNVSSYLMGLEGELQTGGEIDGPGDSDLTWTVEVLDQGAAPPPRRVCRLYPKANATEIRRLAKPS